ncbi:UPF0280 family protein [Desulfosoma caldarium]|uniref:Uncharacterized protein n=1 Tax=Desulfosoma caldarium TaxID=610254 RepID=A0A3N1UQY2_9BACT|nr:UPF0280 family protein [Desulfosoma caldarium]ROQ91110.1 hypothetical protein EDC27_2387 [Desulfosoma caldarium]
MDAVGSVHRFYREHHRPGPGHAFHVQVEQTDLWVRADADLSRQTHDLVLTFRRQILQYGRTFPDFLTSLMPLPEDPLAPEIVRRMLRAGLQVGVGPMAAVAGAIAQAVAEGLLPWTTSVIVENGGDCYAVAQEALVVAVYPGKNSPFRDRLALKLAAEDLPMAVCTSSGSLGHSLSFGRADAATVLSKDAALADACATALGNRIQHPDDLEPALTWIQSIPGVLGALAIMHDRLAAWGHIALTSP